MGFCFCILSNPPFWVGKRTREKWPGAGSGFVIGPDWTNHIGRFLKYQEESRYTDRHDAVVQASKCNISVGDFAWCGREEVFWVAPLIALQLFQFSHRVTARNSYESKSVQIIGCFEKKENEQALE